MSDILLDKISDKLDKLNDDVHDVKTQGELTVQAVSILKDEFSEHKRLDTIDDDRRGIQDKKVSEALRGLSQAKKDREKTFSRNVVIIGVIIAVLSCYFTYKSMDTEQHKHGNNSKKTGEVID